MKNYSILKERSSKRNLKFMKANFFFVIILLFLISCTKKEDKNLLQKAEITIADYSASLKISGNDTLFVLTLVSTKKAYILNDIIITASLSGQTENQQNFTLNDANGNNQFDQGESIMGIESGGNIFDNTHINKSVNVYFREKQSDGTYFQAATGVWTPTN